MGDAFHGTIMAEGIELEIFDVAGRLVKKFILYPSPRAIGKCHTPSGITQGESFILPAKLEWDGKDDYGKILPSAIYYIRLTQGNLTQTRKILFVK